MTCVTCHMPGHAPGAIAGRPDEPAGALHLLRGAVPGERNAICFKCHAKSQWADRSPHQDVARKQKGCTLCHAVDPEEGDTDTFVADITIVCLACHGNPDHPAGVRHTVTLTAKVPEVRGPLPLGPGRRITCATCHDPHLDTPTGHRLRGGGTENAFCSRCHSF
jgi:predicted CXXCH cytochrome family protein